MQNSGVALMGTGIAEGENRALEAIQAATTSKLLNDNDILTPSEYLNINTNKDVITLEESRLGMEFIRLSSKLISLENEFDRNNVDYIK